VRRKLLTALILGAFSVGLSAHPTSRQILLEYVPTQDKDSHWVRPMIAPLLQVQILEGKAPAQGDRRTTMCTQVYRDHKGTRDGVEVVSHVVVFLCEDGTALEMTNVYFGEVK
jgi:hypothetical protein